MQVVKRGPCWRRASPSALCPLVASPGPWGSLGDPVPPHDTHDQRLQPVVQVAVEGKLLLDEAHGLLQRRAGCPREGRGVHAGRAGLAVCWRGPLGATIRGLRILLWDTSACGAVWTGLGRGGVPGGWQGTRRLLAWALGGLAPEWLGRVAGVEAGCIGPWGSGCNLVQPLLRGGRRLWLQRWDSRGGLGPGRGGPLQGRGCGAGAPLGRVRRGLPERFWGCSLGSGPRCWLLRSRPAGGCSVGLRGLLPVARPIPESTESSQH